MYQQIQKPKSHGFAKILTVIDLIAAAIVIAVGVLGIVYMVIHNLISTRFFLIFNPIFLILFGLMMVAAQLKIKFLLKECHFLTNFIGRGLFFIYLSSSVYWYFSFGPSDETLTYVTSVTIFLLGLMYLILHFTGLTYREQINPIQKDNQNQIV